jgi:hypothetical protein
MRTLLGACASFALLATSSLALRPPAAVAQTVPADQRPFVWVSEHDPAGTGYSWLIAYSAAALRSGATAIAPAAVIGVPNVVLDDVAADVNGAVYAKYGRGDAGFYRFPRGSNGLAAPQISAWGTRPVQGLAASPEGVVYGVLAPAGNFAPTLVASNGAVPAAWQQGWQLNSPDALAASTTALAEATHPEPPQNIATLNIFTSSGFRPAFMSGAGSIGGIAFDLNGALYAIVPVFGFGQLVRFGPGDGYVSRSVVVDDVGVRGIVGRSGLAVGRGTAYVLGQGNHLRVYDLASGGRLLNDVPCCAVSLPPGSPLRAPNGVPTSIAAEP